MTHIRKIVSFTLFSLFIFGSGCHSKRPEPNIVLIVVDTLRADHLPIYGYPKNTAPFLFRLASEHIVFNQAISTSSWTAPATASIFSSLYPFQHGVVNGYIASTRLSIELNRIPKKIRTLPIILKENGYSTFGLSENVNIGEKMGFARGFDKFKKFKYSRRDKINSQMKEWRADIQSRKKYFVYIHYNDPHQPYYRRQPFYKENVDARAETVSRYDSEIHHVDSKIKELYELFSWSENTLFILTSDHGEEFWDHGKTGHGNSLYSEAIRVPLIVQLPERDRIKGRIKAKVSSLDIKPTIRDYLRIERKGHEEGLSLLKPIRGKDGVSDDRYIFSHLQKNERLVSIIRGDWKLIFSRTKQELYNLTDDPGEITNRAGRHKKLFRQLHGDFQNFYDLCPKFAGEKFKITLDDRKKEELRALGYIK